jgi:hypothetical protein
LILLVFWGKIIFLSPKNTEKSHQEPSVFKKQNNNFELELFASYTPSSKRPVSEVIIKGPLDHMDIIVNNHSIFDPVIIEPNMSEADRVSTVFYFLNENYYTWNLPTDMGIRAMLYGTSYGLCGEESLVMCSLWNSFGMKSRTVSWPRHVMGEVLSNGNWQLFDAQHKTNYSLLNKVPTSCEMIIDNENYIPEALDDIGYEGTYLRKIVQEAKPHSVIVMDKLIKPIFNLSETQSITIKPRVTDSKSILPISEKPNTRSRSDLLPIYELKITQEDKATSFL